MFWLRQDPGAWLLERRCRCRCRWKPFTQWLCNFQMKAALPLAERPETASTCCSNTDPAPSLQWRHNEHYDVSNHRRLDCLPNRLFMRRLKKTSKLCVTGLFEGNPPVTGGFPSHRASIAENVSIWWRHHVIPGTCIVSPDILFSEIEMLSRRQSCHHQRDIVDRWTNIL